MAIMVEYDSNTPHFEEEPDKVVTHLSKMKDPGEWKNQDLGTGAGNNSVDVTVKGPSTDAIRSTVTKVENKMKSIKGVADVNSDLSQTYDQYEIKVIKIKQQIKVFQLHN